MPAGATRFGPGSDAARAESQLPLNLPHAAAAGFPRHGGKLLQPPRAAPVLDRAPKAPRKCAAAPMQTSSYARVPASANSSEVCSMAAVTIPGCMYSCWDKAHTVERCACCWQGQQLAGNSCEACPVGSYARRRGDVCQECSTGYSTFSEASVACNGRL
jgi:hypothetical protein